MKSLFKFVFWSVAIVLGFGLSSWLFSLLGELATAKNSVAVAASLLGYGVLLGIWGWVVVTAIKKGVKAFFEWDPDADKSESCCQNDCGCDRTR